jgi:2-methylisocitrate lyase-like PEP mutase family enzyme
MTLQAGAGTSASRIGHADLGIANLNDMRENPEIIANLDDSVPHIADANTGYGGTFHSHSMSVDLRGLTR